MNATKKKTGSRPLVLVVLVATMAALVVASAPQATAANSHNAHYREFAQGAYINYSTCSWDDAPVVADTVCEDFSVWYIRSGVSLAGGSLGRATQPFVAAYFHLRFLEHPDGEVEDLGFEFGATTDVVGSYDKTHLTSARMDGATIELNDFDPESGEVTPNGKTVTLGPFTWTAATDTYRYGNDGPVFWEFPDVRDRCHTTVTHAHQRFRQAHVTGTVDGVPISTYYLEPPFLPGVPEDANGGIFNNNGFRVIDVTHGGKNCL